MCQLSVYTFFLQIKLLQPPQIPTQPGPPTTHTTTSSPQAPCLVPPLPPQRHLPRASLPSPHLLANQTTQRPGKSITKKSVSVWATTWVQVSQRGRRGQLCPLTSLPAFCRSAAPAAWSSPTTRLHEGLGGVLQEAG